MKSVCVLAMVLVLAGCSGSATKESQGVVLAPKEFQDKFTPDAVIIDVRTQAEFLEGNLPNSLNIDFKSEEFEKNISILDKEKTYLVYCASGVRSAKAMEVMGKQGFTHVFALEGGLNAWKAAGMPMD